MASRLISEFTAEQYFCIVAPSFCDLGEWMRSSGRSKARFTGRSVEKWPVWLLTTHVYDCFTTHPVASSTEWRLLMSAVLPLYPRWVLAVEFPCHCVWLYSCSLLWTVSVHCCWRYLTYLVVFKAEWQVDNFRISPPIDFGSVPSCFSESWHWIRLPQQSYVVRTV